MWMGKKEEDKSGEGHVNFVYNIGVEEKALSYRVDSGINSDLVKQLLIFVFS